ncbi:MAG: HIT family protein [Crocinitomicaceae bacterium]
MSSVFSKIISGEIPCHKIAESDQFLAFLDISPLKKGHTLVVPKVEIDYIFDLEEKVLGEMMVFAKSVASKIKSVIPCDRIGVAVIGLEVPHAHIHLIPINQMNDMNFANKKMDLVQEELAKIAKNIRG